MPDSPDVLADPSSDTQEPDQTPDSSSVTSDVIEPAALDRPAVNLKAEFDRKLGRVESKIEELTAILLEQARARQAPVSSEPEPDDEELARDAILGNPKALVALGQRQATKVQAEAEAFRQADNFVMAQLNAIVGKYPSLRDAASPLRGKVEEARRALLALGYNDGKALTLEAVKLAILDNPDLARSQSAPAPVLTPSSTSAAPMASVPGNAPRRKGTAPVASTVTPAQAAIAKRMGVDPVKATKNFEERMKNGRSALSPMLAVLIREDSNA